MSHNKFFFIYIILIHCKSVFLSPVSIQSQSSVLDDQAQHKNADTFGVHSQNGNTGGRYAAGFSQENDKKHAVAQDSGGYNNINNDRNSQENAQQYFGEKAHQQNAGSASQFGREGGHKKGHRKSGFQNSYHKEENENKSSFYDDIDDQGGHFVYDSRGDGFSSAGGGRNQGSKVDGHLYANNNGQKGGYDQGGNYDRARGDKNAYNQNGYYDNNQNQGKQNAANAQGGSGRHLESNYYNQQPQYYPQYAPRRTITVYEDPRDLYSGPEGYNNYRGGYNQPHNQELIHLNYRPNPYLQYNDHITGGYY